MLRFVYDNIKLYNVREGRERSLYVEVIMYNQVSRCFKTTGSDHSVCTILSGDNKIPRSNIINFLDSEIKRIFAVKALNVKGGDF